jgi:hypothetical protein
MRSIDDQNSQIYCSLMKSSFKSSTSGLVVRGMLAGLSLGVVARLWMRWISTDPEFSWSGTIFIVGAFTIFFTTHSIVAALRRENLSPVKRRIVRAGGIIFSLPIFMAAGGIMFPTVALASFALWTRILQRRSKVILFILSAIIPLRISMDIVRDFGWSIATVGRILLFVNIYVAVIFATRPTLRPFEGSAEVRMSSFSRRKQVTIFLGILILVALFLLFTVGLPGD